MMRIYCSLLFIYGVVSQDACQLQRDAICAPPPTANPLKLRNITDIDEFTWEEEGESVGYHTDGYIVALSGKVKWNADVHPDEVLGEGYSGSNPNSVIGRIDGDFCPTYNAVFTTTNDQGLLCTIEITKPLSDGYYCNIVLKSWSISLLYYHPEHNKFYFVDDLKIFDKSGNTGDPKELELRVMNATLDTTLTLDKLYHVQLDGITYIRAEALTFAYENGTAPATTTPSPTAAGRRLLASDGGMDCAPEIVTAAGFLSSLSLSQIVVLGFCFGSSLFAGQVLMSYTQIFKLNK